MPGAALERIKPSNPDSSWHTHPGSSRGNPRMQIPSPGDFESTEFDGVPGLLLPADGGIIVIQPDGSTSVAPPPGETSDCRSEL